MDTDNYYWNLLYNYFIMYGVFADYLINFLSPPIVSILCAAGQSVHPMPFKRCVKKSGSVVIYIFLLLFLYFGWYTVLPICDLYSFFHFIFSYIIVIVSLDMM